MLGSVVLDEQVRELVHEHVVEHPRRERREPRRHPDRRVLGRARSPALLLVVRPLRPSSGGAGRTRGRGAGRAPTTSIRAGSMRRRMRSASSSAASCASASDIQRGNDTRNRSPTSAASTCLRRRVPRTSSISMAPSISSRCDSLPRVFACRRPIAPSSHAVRASRRYRRRVVATKSSLPKREVCPRERANFRLTVDGRGPTVAHAGSPLRRLRICHPADSERAHERAGRTEPFGAACARAAGGRRRAPARAARGERRRPRDGPRGDRSCDAAKTTRGLPASVGRRRGAVTGGRASHPTGTVARVTDHDSLLDGSRPAPARRGHRAARAARDPRAGRLGQDARAHPPHRVPRPRAARRAPPRARGHLHPPGRRRARRPARRARRRRAVTAGTFHALALAQLRGRAADRRQELPRVLDRKGRVLAPLLGTRRLGRVGRAGDRRRRDRDRVGEGPHDHARALRGRGPRGRAPAAPARRPSSPTSTRATKPRSARQRWLDFDDLLGWCADAIERDADFAAAQRWRFRHLFVDEFQDATPLQIRLLRAWLGDRTDLCVVGDGAQAIYAFAGADASPLTDFARHFPGGRTIALVVQLPVDRRDRRGRRGRARAGVGRRARRAARGAPRRPRGRRSRAFDDDAQEAATVADACWHEFTGGVPWHRMAVLFRTNAQSSLFETALARRGVPFRLTGAQRFAARPAVRVLLDRLRDAERARAGATVRRAPRRPRRRRRRRVPTTARRRRTAPHAPRPPSAPADDDELRTHRDALLRFGRDYVAAERGRLGRGVRLLARVRDARRSRRRTRRRPRDVPPRQGPRVAGRVRHRARARPRADLVGHDAGGARRGAAAAPRRARPRRRLGPLLVGARAHRARPPRRAPAQPVARRARARRSRAVPVAPVDPKARIGDALAALQQPRHPSRRATPAG